MTKNINVWDYLIEYNEEKSDLLDAVEHVFSSGSLVLGESVTQFENDFSKYCGVGHAVGVDNGTNALSLGLRALGVSKGDEVITVSNTAAPTVVAIRQLGAIPRFVDIDPRSYLMLTDSLAESITDKTRCILPVHLYGQCVDMKAVTHLANEHDLKVLEDCAQCHGASQNGQISGSFSDAAAFSFYPTKVLGAYGDAGMIISNNESFIQRVKRLRYYGMDADRYFVMETPGFNSRLDSVQAEILRRKLKRLDNYIMHRQQIAGRYSEQLGETELQLPTVVPGNTHVYYVYVVRHPERDQIIHDLRTAGININISYPWPCHLQAGLIDHDYPEGSLPHTELAAKEVFSLPMYPSLSSDQQDRVCSVLRNIFK